MGKEAAVKHSEEAGVSHSEAGLNLSEKKGQNPLSIFFKDARLVFKKDELGLEILRIALPAALALTADPIASLIDTAFIGHIGPVELAAVGVSIAVFNQVSKIAIFPIVSATTSFVAEEDTAMRLKDEQEEINDMEKACPKISEMKEPISETGPTVNKLSSTGVISNKIKLENKRKHLPSATSAIIIGGILGLLLAILLIFGAKPILHVMGVKSDSPMLTPARKYLILRSLGAPAILLSLAMQGIFRGFKDTKTPLYAIVIRKAHLKLKSWQFHISKSFLYTPFPWIMVIIASLKKLPEELYLYIMAGDVLNVILDPILIFVFHMGVSGAAIAHIISQYLVSVLLLWRLMTKIDLLPKRIQDLQFRRFLKSGSLLLARVVAATFCVTLAASLAARHGSTTMAAFQICLQIWLATSLLADGLAVAGQAILACAFAANDLEKARATTSRVLQMGMVLGLALSVILGLGLQFGARLFTKDVRVLQLISIGVPFVAATQPLNALAFVFDGVNFGASDFSYAAYSMVFVSILSIVSLFLLSSSHGFIGIWIGLTIYMTLRLSAGFWRIGTGTGPWRFLWS